MTLKAETRGLIGEAALARALRRLDNVILTPHAAYFSSATVAQVPQRCGEEIARVLMKERPLNVVNPEVYARESRRGRGP